MHQPGPEQEPALEAECLDSDGVHERVARLPGVATQLIGERLRTMYGLIVSEPIPDELLNLIRQLESKERTE